MKKVFLSLLATALIGGTVLAVDYATDSSNEISAAADQLGDVSAILTDADGAKVFIAGYGGDGQDVKNANLISWADNNAYNRVKFELVSDSTYFIHFVDSEGNVYSPRGTWHDGSGILNITGNGGALFIGGKAGRNGQDAANYGLWTVSKEEGGYAIKNVGTSTYLTPASNAPSAEKVLVKLYSELKDATPDNDRSSYIVNPLVNGSDGWTVERPFEGNGPLLNGTAFEYWGGNATNRDSARFDYYQLIANLPAGKYYATADMYNSSNGEQGDGHAPNGNAGLYIANDSLVAFVGIVEDAATLKTYQTDTIVVNEGDTLRLGVRSTGYLAARWFVADNFKLYYAGALTVDVESVSLGEDFEMNEGDEPKTITATVLPADATDPSLTWSSTNEAVATVDNGTVTAVAEGEALIIATATNGKADTVKVNVWAVEEEVGKRVSVLAYNFNDADSPALTAGSRASLDYSHTSVVNGSVFLNIWGANNTNGATSIALATEDLTDKAGWVLEFDWAGYSGCNGKAGATVLKAGETTLFSINDAAGWGATMPVKAGSLTADLPVYPCNKANRISAATGDALNTLGNWNRVVVKGSEDGVTLSITNCETGKVVVRKALLSETNVTPTELLITPGSCGAMAIDSLSLDYLIVPTISPVVEYSFNDADSPALTAGTNTTYDYTRTSVISETPFLNIWGANNTTANTTIALSQDDLTGNAYWTLDFYWAGYSGCNKRAGLTELIAGETTLFTINDDANWGATMPLSAGGQTFNIPVAPCSKATRISANVANDYNNATYWMLFSLKGSENGVVLNVTNAATGAVVAKNVLVSETNVTPSAINVRPGSCGGIGIDSLTLNIAAYGKVVKNPVVTVTGKNTTSALVELSCGTAGAAIKYSFEGEDGEYDYTESFRLFTTKTINVWAVEDSIKSSVVVKLIHAGEVAVPTAKITAVKNETRTIEMACATEGAEIYYGETKYEGAFDINETLACGVVGKLKDEYTDAVFVSDTLKVNFEAGVPVQLNQVTFATVDQNDSVKVVVLNNNTSNVLCTPTATISYEIYPSNETGTLKPGDTLTVAYHQCIKAIASAENYASSELAEMWVREPADLELVWEICFDTIAQTVSDKNVPAVSAETFNVGGKSFGQMTIGDSIINENFGAFITTGEVNTYLVRSQNTNNTGLEDYHTSSAFRYIGLANLKKTQVVKFFTYRYDSQIVYSAIADLFPSYSDVLEYDASNSTPDHMVFNVVKDGSAWLALGRYLVFKDVAVYNNPEVTPSPNVYVAGKEGDARKVVIMPSEVSHPENQFTYYSVSNGFRVDQVLVSEATETSEAVYRYDTVALFTDFAPYTEPITVTKPNNTVVAYTVYEGKASDETVVEIDCDSIYALNHPTIAWVEKSEEGHTFAISNTNLVELGLYPELNYSFNGQTGTLYGAENELTIAGSGWLTVQAVLPGMDSAYVVSRYVAEDRESYNADYMSIMNGDTLTLSGIKGDIEVQAGAAVKGEYPTANLTVGGVQLIHKALKADNFTSFALPFAFTVGTNVVTDAKGNELKLGEDYEILTLQCRKQTNTLANADVNLLISLDSINSCVRTSGSIPAGAPMLFRALSEKAGSEVIFASAAKAALNVKGGNATVPNAGWRVFGNSLLKPVALETSAYVLNAAGTKLVYKENPTIAALDIAVLVDSATHALLGDEIKIVDTSFKYTALEITKDTLIWLNVADMKAANAAGWAATDNESDFASFKESKKNYTINPETGETVNVKYGGIDVKNNEDKTLNLYVSGVKSMIVYGLSTSTSAERTLKVEAIPADAKNAVSAVSALSKGETITLSLDTKDYGFNKIRLTGPEGDMMVYAIKFIYGDPTGIESVEETEEIGAIYDLQGRKAETFKKGQVYIVNGRRVMTR